MMNFLISNTSLRRVAFALLFLVVTGATAADAPNFAQAGVTVLMFETRDA